jgi:predicted MFS family arabinose efflux permease
MNAPCTTCTDTPTPELASPARSPWLAVASLAVGSFAMVTTEFLPIGLLTDIAQGLKVSDGTAGLMVTMPGLLAAFAGPALIVASGKLDRRRVLIALTLLLVASNLLAALAPNFGTILVARLMLGLCVGGFWTFAPGAATQLVPEASRARAMSLVLAGVSLATVFGVPAGAMLGNLAGWRAGFAVTGVLAAAVLLVQIWLLPAMPPERAIVPRDLLVPLRRRMAQVGLLAALFLIAGHFSTYTYLKPLLQQVFSLPPGAVTLMLLLYGAIGFIGTFVGGSLVVRSVRGTTLLAAVLLAAALLMSTQVSGGMAGVALVVFLWGGAFGLIPVALTAWMLEAVPDAQEAGQAMLVSGIQIAIAVGAVLGGATVDGYGIKSAMLLGAALVLVAAVVVGAFGRPGAQGSRAARATASGS